MSERPEACAQRVFTLALSTRTSYYRCAFQLATSNDVRISLDTQMSLLDEYVEASAAFVMAASDAVVAVILLMAVFV